MFWSRCLQCPSYKSLYIANRREKTRTTPLTLKKTLVHITVLSLGDKGSSIYGYVIFLSIDWSVEGDFVTANPLFQTLPAVVQVKSAA